MNSIAEVGEEEHPESGDALYTTRRGFFFPGKRHDTLEPFRWRKWVQGPVIGKLLVQEEEQESLFLVIAYRC